MKIFVSSPGRSGTAFLSKLFGNVTAIPSFHAVKPYCTGSMLWKFNNGDSNKELNKKIQEIKKNIENGNYFESSPGFIKCFVEKVIEEFGNIYVIHLVRDPLKVAKSFINRNSYPDNIKSIWRLSMKGKKNILKMNGKGLTKFQKNLWEWLEVELRYNFYKNRFAKTFDLDFENINNSNIYISMFKKFEILYNKNNLVRILKRRTLFKNANKMKTVITKNDIQEGKLFIKKLKSAKFNRSMFKDDIYQNFQFIKWMDVK